MLDRMSEGIDHEPQIQPEILFNCNILITAVLVEEKEKFGIKSPAREEKDDYDRTLLASEWCNTTKSFNCVRL